MASRRKATLKNLDLELASLRKVTYSWIRFISYHFLVLEIFGDVPSSEGLSASQTSDAPYSAENSSNKVIQVY